MTTSTTRIFLTLQIIKSSKADNQIWEEFQTKKTGREWNKSNGIIDRIHTCNSAAIVPNEFHNKGAKSWNNSLFYKSQNKTYHKLACMYEFSNSVKHPTGEIPCTSFVLISINKYPHLFPSMTNNLGTLEKKKTA